VDLETGREREREEVGWRRAGKRFKNWITERNQWEAGVWIAGRAGGRASAGDRARAGGGERGRRREEFAVVALGRGGEEKKGEKGEGEREREQG
jgi:hypothetical protein